MDAVLRAMEEELKVLLRDMERKLNEAIFINGRNAQGREP